jgi:hypothetical protein
MEEEEMENLHALLNSDSIEDYELAYRILKENGMTPAALNEKLGKDVQLTLGF